MKHATDVTLYKFCVTLTRNNATTSVRMTNTFVTHGYIEGNFKITLILLKSAVETKSRNVDLVT